MAEHLILYLTNRQLTGIFFNNNNQITQKVEHSFHNSTIELKTLIKEIKKEKKTIDRILIIAEDFGITNTFINFHVNATDDFNQCLIERLTAKGFSLKDCIIKYKILSESHANKIEYLVSLAIIPLSVYRTICNALASVKPEKLLQWVPSDYCIISSIINDKKLQGYPLVALINANKTYVLFKKESQLITVSSFPFSNEEIKKSLEKDGLSDNQIQNKFSIENPFDDKMGFNTKQLLYTTIDELKKDLRFQYINYKLTISSAAIITEQLKHSGLAHILSTELIMPCAYEALPEMDISSQRINPVQEKKLLMLTFTAMQIIKNLQVFLSFTPTKKSNFNNKKNLKIPKESIIFITLFLIMLFATFSISIGLSYRANTAKESLYGIKEQLTLTKAQYIDSIESLHGLRRLQEEQKRILALEKENEIIKTSLSQILTSIPKEINHKDITITLRNKRILITGQNLTEQPIHNLVNLLIKKLPEQKILLRRITPTKPIRFVIEVQI